MDTLISYFVIGKLDILDILNLCQTNKEINDLCISPYTWRLLLRRDFNVIYKEDDAYNEYGRQLIKYLIGLMIDIGTLYNSIERYVDSSNYYMIALELEGHDITGEGLDNYFGLKIAHAVIEHMLDMVHEDEFTLRSLILYIRFQEQELDKLEV